MTDSIVMEFFFVTELIFVVFFAHMCFDLKYVFVCPFSLVIMHSVLMSNWSSFGLSESDGVPTICDH